MADELDLVVAKDELVLAERAVAMLEQERAERLADVESLDGTWTAAWTRLMGTREARIEAAVAAVARVEARLAAAKQHLARARAAAEGVGAAKERKEAEERDRVARREAALGALAAGGGPIGTAAQTRLLERDLLRERHALLDEAVFAGSDLLAALNTVVRANRTASKNQTTVRQELYGEFAGGVALGAEVSREFAAYQALGLAKEGRDAVPPRADRFRAAMAELGRRVEFPAEAGASVSPLTSLLLDGPLLETLVWERSELQANQYEDVADEVRRVMVSVEQERRDVRERLTELESELDALLQR